jgi:hybrid cluster-associated redox disulfide protein
MNIEPTDLVDDVMRETPATIRVFLNHRMRCVGCPIACFHSVDDACREHGVDRARFLADLNAVVGRRRASSQRRPRVIQASLRRAGRACEGRE